MDSKVSSWSPRLSRTRAPSAKFQGPFPQVFNASNSSQNKTDRNFPTFRTAMQKANVNKVPSFPEVHKASNELCVPPHLMASARVGPAHQ